MFDFLILGPIEVLRDGHPIEIGGAKQRALVAELALHANQVVSAGRIIEDIWGDEPPATAEHMLHVLVSRLRKILRDDDEGGVEGAGRDILITKRPGYELRLHLPDELDAARFEDRRHRAREQTPRDPEGALATLDEALSLWRGPLLDDIADESFVAPHAARFDQLFSAAHEDRIELLLSLGRNAEAIPQLDGLIERFPLRERLRALSMLALYRSGRQADALAAFHAARSVLAEELGIDPGPELVALEQAILRQDDDLRWTPAPSPTGVSEPATSPGNRASPSRWVAAIVVVLTAVAVTAVLTHHPRVGAAPASPSARVAGPSTGGTATSSPATGRLELLPVDPTAFRATGAQTILDAVATDRGVVAVGSSTSPSAGGLGRDYDVGVWLGDSSGWRPVTDPSLRYPGNQHAAAITQIGGTLVALGTDTSGLGKDAAVWRSTTRGRTWERADEASSLRVIGDQEMRAATTVRPRLLVAVGDDDAKGDPDPAVWTSIGGSRWTPNAVPYLSKPGDQEMDSVAVIDGRVVAGGFDTTTKDAAVWTSPDGDHHWRRVPDPNLGGPGVQQIKSIVQVGARLVAVGYRSGEGGSDAEVWTSGDGLRWTPAVDVNGALGGPGSQIMYAVEGFGDGLVAVGEETSDSGRNGVVWTSSDGLSWKRVTSLGASALSGYGNERPTTLLPFRGGLYVLGRGGTMQESDAAVWFSRRP